MVDCKDFVEIKVIMRRCPCCGYLTIDDSYEVAQDKPDINIGPNKVSLNTAKKNYKLFGASEERFLNMVRLPYKDEI